MTLALDIPLNDVGGSIVDDEGKVQAWGGSHTPGAESE